MENNNLQKNNITNEEKINYIFDQLQKGGKIDYIYNITKFNQRVAWTKFLLKILILFYIIYSIFNLLNNVLNINLNDIKDFGNIETKILNNIEDKVTNKLKDSLDNKLNNVIEKGYSGTINNLKGSEFEEQLKNGLDSLGL